MSSASIQKEKFRKWLLDHELSPSSATKYVTALEGSLSRWAAEAGLYAGGIFTIEDVDTLTSVAAKLSDLDIVKERNKIGKQMYSAALNRYKEFLAAVDDALPMESDIRKKQDRDVNRALKLSAAERRKHLKEPAAPPRKYVAQTTVFDRSPYVVAEVLFQAEGKCQGCGQPAPFSRRSDNSPYLEVHHRKPLAEGGLDTVENAIALCPNCHRQAHFG